MKWSKKEEIKKWQYYVVDMTGKGYRINSKCQPLWQTTPDQTPYLEGTYGDAERERHILLENWTKIHGSPAREIYIQEYSDIPHHFNG